MPRTEATPTDAALVAAAVALCGSQAAAARACGVSQPRLSKASVAGAGRALSEPQRAALRGLLSPSGGDVAALLGEVEALLLSPSGGVVLTADAGDGVYAVRIGKGWLLSAVEPADRLMIALGSLALTLRSDLPGPMARLAALRSEVRALPALDTLTATRGAQPLLTTLRRLSAALQEKP